MRTLGDETRGEISFLSIPRLLLVHLARAGNIPVTGKLLPAGRYDSAELPMRENLGEWVDGHWALLPGGEYILPLLPRLKAKPVFHHFTVCEIGIDDTGEVRSLQTNVEWRWEGFFYAFTVFWAFIFHTSNEDLKKPELLWQTIKEHLATGFFCRPEEGAMAFWLALYERLIAIRFRDVGHQEDHYFTNIVARPGLTPSEWRERPVLFREAIDYLLTQVVRELKVLAAAKK